MGRAQATAFVRVAVDSIQVKFIVEAANRPPN
jgi:hypothetical protein